MDMHKSIIPYDEKKMIYGDQSHGSPGKNQKNIFLWTKSFGSQK